MMALVAIMMTMAMVTVSNDKDDDGTDDVNDDGMPMMTTAIRWRW